MTELSYGRAPRTTPRGPEFLMVPAGLRMEVVNPNLRHGPRALAMIDFDGTLSLLREGWDRVMIPMMVEVLLPFSDGNRDRLHNEVAGWVLKLNGQPTIEQMAALAREVQRHGGTPENPADYKREYLTRLMREVDKRKQAIRAGGNSEYLKWVVPGAHDLLRELQRRGIPMFLSSGTDLQPLREEAALLRLADFFTDGIHGPDADDSTFTKAAALDAILHRHGLQGEQLINFGDGYVETQATKDRGGLAIGVAHDPDHPGHFHPWRRDQLHDAGADLILPDLLQSQELLAWLL